MVWGGTCAARGVTLVFGSDLFFSVENHVGVSKNRGTPKWMVKIMENPNKNG